MGKVLGLTGLVLLSACAAGRARYDSDGGGVADAATDAAPPQRVDQCDGTDDDADPVTPDGYGDPRVGDTCAAPADQYACGDWETVCRDGHAVCEQRFGPTAAPVALTADLLPPEAGEEDSAHITWDGEAFVVVFSRWEQTGTTYYWVRIDVDGRRLAGPTVLAEVPEGFFVAAASAGDGRSLVAWSRPPIDEAMHEGRGLVAAIVDATGEVLSEVPLEGDALVGYIAVAADERGYLLAYLSGDARVDAELGVWAVPVDREGALGTPVAIGTTNSDDSTGGRLVSAVGDDDGWVVAWKNVNGPRVRTLDALGAPRGAEQVPAPDYVDSVDLAPGPDGFAMVWHVAAQSSLSLRLLDGDAAPRTPPLSVSPSPTAYIGSSMVRLEDGYGLVWQGWDFPDENDGIFFAVVGDDGQTLCTTQNLFCSADDDHFLLVAREDIAFGAGFAGVVFKAGRDEWSTGSLYYVKVRVADCGPI